MQNYEMLLALPVWNSILMEEKQLPPLAEIGGKGRAEKWTRIGRQATGDSDCGITSHVYTIFGAIPLTSTSKI